MAQRSSVSTGPAPVDTAPSQTEPGLVSSLVVFEIERRAAGEVELVASYAVEHADWL